jgi:hypothetical protein
VDVIDASDRGPIFIGFGPVCGKATDRTRVRPVPGFPDKIVRGVRCPPQWGVGDGISMLFQSTNLFSDPDHGLAEAIELGFGFGLGGFDHQCARDRKAHCRGMEAKIDQPFGDVINTHAAGTLVRARIQNAFVRHTATRIFVEHGEMRLESARDIVRRDDGRFSGASPLLLALPHSLSIRILSRADNSYFRAFCSPIDRWLRIIPSSR